MKRSNLRQIFSSDKKFSMVVSQDKQFFVLISYQMTDTQSHHPQPYCEIKALLQTAAKHLKTKKTTFSDLFQGYETVSLELLIQTLISYLGLHIPELKNSPQQTYHIRALDSLLDESSSEQEPTSEEQNLHALLLTKKASENLLSEIKPSELQRGLHGLSKFMMGEDSDSLFKICDDEQKGFLTKTEFNKFLLCSGVKEMSDKNLRTYLIKKIFQIADLGDKVFLDQIKNELGSNSTNYLPDSSMRMSISQGFQTFYQNLILNKMGQDEIKEFSEIGIKDSYPYSLDYYRLGLPTKEDFAFLEFLEKKLSKRKIYLDQRNPKAEGQYKSAKDIFQQKSYKLFSIASSVYERQRSRVGVAQMIQPKDIIQGQIKNCYFMSALTSVVSAYPEILSDNFLFSENQANFYAIRLFIDGEWRTIQTDDRFPCDHNNIPIYAKPHGNQIWSMLIQKCFAKIYGSYKSLDSGISDEGFKLLTGAPMTYHDALQVGQEEMLKILLRAFKERYVITVSGSKYLDSLDRSDQNRIGLFNNHSYSILKLFELNKQKVVKMRNPWGKKSWNGQWSFDSPKWTRQLRKNLSYQVDHEDGVFYMPWKQLLKYFSGYRICHINPTFMHTTFPISEDLKKIITVQMRVLEKGSYTISVYQQNKRKFQKIGYEYSPFRFQVFKKSKKQRDQIGSAYQTNFFQISKEIKLSPHKNYEIQIRIYWRKGQTPRSVVLSSYGPEKVEFFNISAQKPEEKK